jgi:2-dehydropantoate 2-reductase
MSKSNAGYLLIGELGGGGSERSERVHQWFIRAVNVNVTPNLQGAVWSKLLLTSSVTTLGAIAGQTMREYIDRPGGRELFYRTYDEALSIALASGVRPEKKGSIQSRRDATDEAFRAKRMICCSVRS